MPTPSTRESLAEGVQWFIERYNQAVDIIRRRRGQLDLETVFDVSDRRIKWTRQVKAAALRLRPSEFHSNRIRRAVYRPFTTKLLYFDPFWNEEQYKQPRIFPAPAIEQENRAIGLTGLGSEKPFMAVMTDCICDLHLVGTGCGSQCFPFYIYDPDGSNRRENITDLALDRFRTHYNNLHITKWDVFHYIYALLHHPAYRERFADNLKRELPRIPFATDFAAFAQAGSELARLHVGYEQLEPWPLQWIEDPKQPLSYRVERMRLGKDKTSLAVNPSLTLAGLPPEAFDYRLGNRSALEWVIDQYRVTGDPPSDPNRDDDPEYIVRLVGQVVRVSVETVRIVRSLPPGFG